MKKKTTKKKKTGTQLGIEDTPKLIAIPIPKGWTPVKQKKTVGFEKRVTKKHDKGKFKGIDTRYHFGTLKAEYQTGKKRGFVVSGFREISGGVISGKKLKTFSLGSTPSLREADKIVLKFMKDVEKGKYDWKA